MAYFTDDFLNERRKQWLRSIAYVECQANGAWHRGKIEKRTVSGNEIVINATFPDLDETAATITASRIIDVRGIQVAYRQKNVKKAAGQGTFIQMKIPLYETDVN